MIRPDPASAESGEYNPRAARVDPGQSLAFCTEQTEEAFLASGRPGPAEHLVQLPVAHVADRRPDPLLPGDHDVLPLHPLVGVRGEGPDVEDPGTAPGGGEGQHEEDPAHLSPACSHPAGDTSLRGAKP